LADIDVSEFINEILPPNGWTERDGSLEDKDGLLKHLLFLCYVEHLQQDCKL
jgi:hypothetical protein